MDQLMRESDWTYKYNPGPRYNFHWHAEYGRWPANDYTFLCASTQWGIRREVRKACKKYNKALALNLKARARRKSEARGD